MEFRLTSVYYGLMNKNDDKAKEWLDLVSVHASRMEDSKNNLLPRVYIEVDSLEELQSLIEELSIGYRQLSNDEYRFEMLDSIVIDFQFKVITLYDYYLE